MNELLNPAQMYEADRLTIAAGTPGITLMENAGAACVSIIMQVAGKGRTCVVAGPGNNGGDGFVIARLLAEAGWPVTLLLAGDVASLKGDAALVAARWTGDVLPATPDHLDGAEVIVDALFGAGLARDIDGDLARLVGAINHSPAMRIAIDMPSGIDGRTGQVRGAAVRAGHTITFFRAKPGHWLMPGRLYCGRLHVADIGINSHVLSDIKPQQTLNSPALFESFLRPAGPARSQVFSRSRRHGIGRRDRHRCGAAGGGIGVEGGCRPGHGGIAKGRFVQQCQPLDCHHAATGRYCLRACRHVVGPAHHRLRHRPGGRGGAGHARQGSGHPFNRLRRRS